MSTFKDQDRGSVSKVLIIRTVDPQKVMVNLDHVLPFLSAYGKPVYVITMPKNYQALIEMDCVESAKRVISHINGGQVRIYKQQYSFNYARLQVLTRDSQEEFRM